MKTAVTAMLALSFAVEMPNACAGRQKTRQQRDYGPTCRSFLELSGPQRDVYEWWIVGFVAGTGRERAEENKPSFPNMDADEQIRWVSTYCADHPADPMAKAATALVDDLKARAR